jgi:hypothetical protein
MRIGVINKTLLNNGNRFETPVRVRRKPRHRFAMVHAPSVFNGKILAQVTAFERCGRPHVFVSGREMIEVMGTENKRITYRPHKAQRLYADNGIVVHRNRFYTLYNLTSGGNVPAKLGQETKQMKYFKRNIFLIRAKSEISNAIQAGYRRSGSRVISFKKIFRMLTNGF